MLQGFVFVPKKESHGGDVDKGNFVQEIGKGKVVIVEIKLTLWYTHSTTP